MKYTIRHIVTIFVFVATTHANVCAQSKTAEYYTINTAGTTFFQGTYATGIAGGSNFSLSSIHGIHVNARGGDMPPILREGFWMGGRIVVDHTSCFRKAV